MEVSRFADPVTSTAAATAVLLPGRRPGEAAVITTLHQKARPLPEACEVCVHEETVRDFGADPLRCVAMTAGHGLPVPPGVLALFEAPRLKGCPVRYLGPVYLFAAPFLALNPALLPEEYRAGWVRLTGDRLRCECGADERAYRVAA